LEPHSAINEKGYTAIHYASLNNHAFLLQCLIRYIKDYFPKQQEAIISTWLDAKTFEEEFTALHFAVFRGNVKIAKMLIELGADLSLVNK
jgi:ankyrin repeat protein